MLKFYLIMTAFLILFWCSIAFAAWQFLQQYW
jgi:hypothetical protein